MIERLPSSARLKLAALREQADMITTLINRSVSRADDLSRVIASDAQHADTGGRMLERQRLVENLPAQQSRQRILVNMLAAIDRFIEQLPRHDKIGVAPAVRSRDALAGKNMREAIEHWRKSIASTQTELLRVSNAALPLADQQQLVRAHVDRLAQQGKPYIRVNADGVEVKRASSWETASADFLPFMAWLSPRMFGDALTRELESRPRASLEMSAEDKDKQLATLHADLLKFQYMEEHLISAAEADGMMIERRADADPRAVLGIAVQNLAARAA